MPPAFPAWGTGDHLPMVHRASHSAQVREEESWSDRSNPWFKSQLYHKCIIRKKIFKPQFISVLYKMRPVNTCIPQRKVVLYLLICEISLFKSIIIICWSLVDLQCVNFCCTAQWFSYTHIYILFYILFHYGLSQDIGYSSLCLESFTFNSEALSTYPENVNARG